MMRRILPALSLIALAGCHPYAPDSSAFGVNGYAPQRGPVLTGDETTAAKDPAPFSPAQVPAY